jgi:dTDP-D-glucose 4,6-dehydratase
LTDFTQAVADRYPIVLKSRGESLRTYIPICDTIRGIFIAMIRGVSGEAYNISRSDYIFSIFEMAKLFAQNEEGYNCDLIVDSEVAQRSNEAHFCIDSSKLESLGWLPFDDIKSSIRQMIKATIENE